jgi:tRNA threonylcarbamoyladenosine biosynthesis protein TsaB
MKLLAFDTSTDTMSVALTDGVALWQHQGAGGAQASATLIPAIMALLAGAGMALADLDAIVFGRGPGSFTGLRTACAVAQGLALGANVSVLPVNTLLAVAEEARFQARFQSGAQHGFSRFVAMLDARMDEVYVAEVDFTGVPAFDLPSSLLKPEAVRCPAGWAMAGNAFAAYGPRLPQGVLHVQALPTATALLRLAPHWLAHGYGVDADDALPLYVRDKVASTMAERAELAALKSAEA